MNMKARKMLSTMPLRCSPMIFLLEDIPERQQAGRGHQGVYLHRLDQQVDRFTLQQGEIKTAGIMVQMVRILVGLVVQRDVLPQHVRWA